MYRSWCRNDGNHQHCRRFLSDVDGLGSVLHVCVVAVSGAVVRLQQLVQHTVSVSRHMFQHVYLELTCFCHVCRAMLCIARLMPSCGVCLSVCHVRVLNTSSNFIWICRSSIVHEGCWVNCPTKVGNYWQSAEQIRKTGNQAAVDRVRRVAVKDLVLS